MSVILLYAAQDNLVVTSLQRRLASYRTARSLSISTVERRLRRPRHGIQVILMIVQSSEELDQISAIHNLVRDIKLVIVLPGLDSAMVARAHKLGPRYIDYAENGCDQVGAVLDKMMRTPCETAVTF